MNSATIVSPDQLFGRYRTRIDAALARAIEGPDLPPYIMARYQLGMVDESGNEVDADRGKALRPTLCLLMCEALGGDVGRALPAAAGLELLHNFSLIHDDVMDNDRMRRHRPTVWSVWGEAQAINTGDLLHVLAILSVLRNATDAGSAQLARDATEVLATGCGRMTEGQHLDLAFEELEEVTIDEYMAMVGGKSAALFCVAFEVGAIYSGNDDGLRASCRKFGQALGTAFQIRDDVLGIWGDEEETGKPVGSDIRKRKKTLPVIHALHDAAPDDRADLARIFADRTCEPDVSATIEILERSDSLGFALREAIRLRDQAQTILEQLPVSDWGRQAITELAAYITVRSK